MEYLNALIFGRKKLPPYVRKIVEKEGNELVKKIYVCRKPLNKALIAFGNIITLGNLKKAQQKYSYDDLFHLFSVVVLANGNEYLLEKNEVINMKSFAVSKITSDTEFIEINVGHNLTLNELFKNTENYMGGKYLVYDAITNNCQVFISSILKSNNLNDSEINNFIMQDIPSVLDEVGHGYGAFARFATDLASKFDVLLYGASKFKN
jgi:hypothetical protein